MHLILFAVGAFLAIAGGVTMRYGLPLDEYGQSALLTPGMVAFVGGVILIALAAIARSLNRIAARFELQPLPVPPVADLGVGGSLPRRPEAKPEMLKPEVLKPELPKVDVKAEATPDAKPGPAPATPGAREPSAPAAPAAARAKPLFGWLNRARGAAQEPAAPAAPPSAPVLEPLFPDREPVFVSPPTVPRVDLGPLAHVPAERPAAPSVRPPLESLPRQDAPAPRAPVAPPASRASAPRMGDAASTVYKSGVIDGMAYTLFMDGSIEAELPQGKVRFATIDQLQAFLTTGR